MDHLEPIKQTFFQECEEQLAELESGLLKIDDGNHHSEIINAVFRAVHSIKGGAAAFGYDNLVEFVHVFETSLDLLRSGQLSPAPEVMQVLLSAADVLADLIHAVRNGKVCNEEQVHVVENRLNALCAGAQVGPSDELQPLDFSPIPIDLDMIFSDKEDDGVERISYLIYFKPKPRLYARANEAIRVIRELRALGDCSVSCDDAGLPLLSEIDAEGAYFAWTIEISTSSTPDEIEQIFDFVSEDCEFAINMRHNQSQALKDEGSPPPAATHRDDQFKSPFQPSKENMASMAATPSRNSGNFADAVPPMGRESIRVDLEKIERLVNLVGELVINQAVLSQRISEAGLPRGSSVIPCLEELEQLTRDIQDSVMVIRAQPVKPIFQRMSRIIREAASITKKSVRLVLDGETTEVDKTLIEQLTDPLTHMVRNAVDHGIEHPEERVTAGKTEEGTIWLSAIHRSGRVVIEVSDDGAGINSARVREIAIRKGLISDSAVMSDEEINDLIFLPGFSTNSTASAISGRGVGMDVVKRAIQSLGGRISISSRHGYGSTFSMSLPLTLAVLDGMVVKAAGQILVFPLTAIIETMQPRRQNIHYLVSGVRVIDNRAGFVPLIDVGFVLGYRDEEINPATQVALLVETESGEKLALLVDAIQGQRQVVIKSLEQNYGKAAGVAAATILGDGRVALIVDVNAIRDLTQEDAGVRGKVSMC